MIQTLQHLLSIRMLLSNQQRRLNDLRHAFELTGNKTVATELAAISSDILNTEQELSMAATHLRETILDTTFVEFDELRQQLGGG